MIKKKIIIASSIVGGFIAIILILLWTLFALSTVNIEYHTTRINLLSLSDVEIAEAGEFRFGATVIFDKKNKYIKNINDYVEKNPKFAYLKIINIETIFPNKYVIHLAEREELFAIQDEDKYYICDDEFRVLDIKDTFVSATDNPILVKGAIINNEEVKVGTFLDIDQKGIKDFYNAFLVNNRDMLEQQGYFESIEFGVNVDAFETKYYCASFKTFSGKTYQVNNIDYALKYKLQMLFALDCVLLVDDSGNYTYNGQALADDDENNYTISNSKIILDNKILSNVVEVSETDIDWWFESLQ